MVKTQHDSEPHFKRHYVGNYGKREPPPRPRKGEREASALLDQLTCCWGLLRMKTSTSGR